jgi:hypothetical protein
MRESLTRWDYARLASFPVAVAALLIGAAVTGHELNGQMPEQPPATSPPPDHYQMPPAPAH